MCHDDGTLADHDRGLGFDLATLHAQRQRRTLLLGALGAGATIAGGGVLLGSGGSAAAGTSSRAGTCSAEEIPTETAGPYPGDGSNGPDVLQEAGVVRRDIRSSFGEATGTADGVDLTFVLTLRSTSTCKAVPGLAVYAWHCDAAGRYSMYSQGVQDENYLRGVQVTNKRGKVRFTSTYPGCYSGRWPHVHFEVYGDRDSITDGSPLLTSQLALPRKESLAVYQSSDEYAGSETNLDRISLGSDNVFGDDGGAHQLATMSGSVEEGYVAKLVVPIDL